MFTAFFAFSDGDKWRFVPVVKVHLAQCWQGLSPCPRLALTLLVLLTSARESEQMFANLASILHLPSSIPHSALRTPRGHLGVKRRASVPTSMNIGCF